MNKQDLLKIQSHILKVNLHCRCEGCEQKIKKLLQKIDGVYTVCVDADQGKVVVTGDVDPAKLLKKLKKSGKHAELWGGQKSITYNQNYPINPQFQNSQVENIKGVMKKDNKYSQNQKVRNVSRGGGGRGQQQHLVAQLQNVKGAHDLKVPSKEGKSVKFTLPEEEFYGSDDGCEFDESDDDYDDYDDEEEEKGYGRGHSQPVHHNNNKMMPVMMGNGRGPQGPPGMVNGPAHKGIAGGGKIGNHESAKRNDFIDMVKQTKGKNGSYGDNYDDYDDDEEEEVYSRGHSQHMHHHNNKMMPMTMGNDRGHKGPGGMVNGPAHKGIVDGGKIGNHGSARRDDSIDMGKQTKGKSGNYSDDDDYEKERYGHGHGHAKPVHHNNKMLPMMMGNGRGPHGPGGMINGLAQKDNGGGGKVGNYGSVKRDDFRDMVIKSKGKSGNFSEAKNGDKKGNGEQIGKNKGEESIKKKDMKSDGGLLGRLLGSLGKKSKKGIEASDINMKKNNGGGNNKEKEGMKKSEDKLEGHGNEKKNYSKSKCKHDFDFDFDFDGLSLDKNSKDGKGNNGDGDVGRVGQMGPMGNNSPMDQKAVQGLMATNVHPPMNNGGGGNSGGYYQGMQMEPDPYNIQQQQQQQQHMAMMMNQHHHHPGNMNMYPSSSYMMYGRPYPSMNYMPPPPMPSHPMADPITHTFSDENVEGCSIM